MVSSRRNRANDLYLSGVYEGLAPPEPFVGHQLPDKAYSKEQIRSYLLLCRRKCQAVILGLTDERAGQICDVGFVKLGFLELQLNTMRHVQEHAAQLNLLLGRNGVTGPDWIAQARDNVS